MRNIFDILRGRRPIVPGSDMWPEAMSMPKTTANIQRLFAGSRQIYRVKFIRTKAGWVWHMVSRNGNIIAQSGKAHSRRYEARSNAMLVVNNSRYAVVELDK